MTRPLGLSTFGLVTRIEDGGVSIEAAVDEVDEEESLFSSTVGVFKKTWLGLSSVFATPFDGFEIGERKMTVELGTSIWIHWNILRQSDGI